MFERLRELAGDGYPLAAYLFFLIDINRFAPTAPRTFDEAFRRLGIDLRTSGRCSWANYADFKIAPLGPSLVAPVTTPNGRYSALVYAINEVQCSILSRPVVACALAHPSKYGRRVEFLTAEQDVKARLSHIGARLREMGPPTVR